MTRRIRILVVDDHAVVRKGLAALLRTKPDLELVGEASDGDEAIARALELKPDLILMDLVMPGRDGIEAIRDIRHANPEARVLVLTSFSEQNRVVGALRAGALGYLLKDSSPGELLEAIYGVHRGASWIQPSVVRTLATEAAPVRATRAEEVLTGRELEVLRLVSQGLPDRKIAEELTMTEATVRVHISNMLEKLGLENRIQIVLYALRQGWVRLDE